MVDQPSFSGQRAAQGPGAHECQAAPKRSSIPGLYKFGLVNNPGRNAFAGPSAPSFHKLYVGVTGCYSGDYMIYFMANQAVWRPTEGSTRGLDAQLRR